MRLAQDSKGSSLYEDTVQIVSAMFVVEKRSQLDPQVQSLLVTGM